MPALNHDRPPCGFFFPMKVFAEEINPVPVLPKAEWAQHCVLAVAQQRYQRTLAGIFLPKHESWTAWSKHYGVDRNLWAKNWAGLRWLTLDQVAWLNTLHPQAPRAWVDATTINWQHVQRMLTSPTGKKAQAAYAGKIAHFTASASTIEVEPARLLPDSNPLTLLVKQAAADLAEAHKFAPPNPDLVNVLVGPGYDCTTYEDGLIVTVPHGPLNPRPQPPGLILDEHQIPQTTLTGPTETSQVRITVDQTLAEPTYVITEARFF